MKHKIIKLIVIILINYFHIHCALAQTGNVESFLDSITVDLPEAKLTCKARGSLSQIFQKPTKFLSGGNAFFVDTVNKEIGIFEKAVFNNIQNLNEKDTADIFIKVPNVSKENLNDLLFNKRLLISGGATVIFIIKVKTENGVDTFIFDGKDINGNTVTATVYTRVNKLKTITFNSDKFFAVKGSIKIRLSQPPKKLDSNGELTDVFTNAPGTLICQCNGCPVHDFDLSELEAAFDGDLVNDVINEAAK